MRETLQFALISGYFENRALPQKKKKEKARPYFEFVRSFELLRELATSVLTNENCFDNKEKETLYFVKRSTFRSMRKFNYFFYYRFEIRRELNNLRFVILFIVLLFCKMKLFEKKFVTFLYKNSNEQCYESIIYMDLSLFIVNYYSSKEKIKMENSFFIYKFSGIIIT